MIMGEFLENHLPSSRLEAERSMYKGVKAREVFDDHLLTSPVTENTINYACQNICHHLIRAEDSVGFTTINSKFCSL